jgi:hypothetical protein
VCRCDKAATVLSIRLCLLLLLSVCAPSALPDVCFGSPIHDELIVQFAPGTVSFPEPGASLPVATFVPDSALAESLLAMGVVSGRKVFPAYTPADTIRILDTGDTLRLPDLNRPGFSGVLIT